MVGHSINYWRDKSMSWDVYLEKDGTPVDVPRHEEGGTYALGGITEAELNVTYNYGREFRHVWPEPLPDSNCLKHMLDGRTAEETIAPLAAAIEKLGTTRDDYYWAATPGNAGYALSLLLGWARANPDATWRVS